MCDAVYRWCSKNEHYELHLMAQCGVAETLRYRAAKILEQILSKKKERCKLRFAVSAVNVDAANGR